MTDKPNPLDALAHVHVCGCGSCKKAVEDALAEFQKLTGPEGCIHWYMTRVTINAVIVNLIANDPRVPDVAQRIVERQSRLQEHFVTDEMLAYLMEQIEAIDAANVLRAEGGKPN